MLEAGNILDLDIFDISTGMLTFKNPVIYMLKIYSF